MWARLAYGVSFIFNTYNLQSISVFATTPLLLALGQTFVIISAGIDLSLGFVMGLASVIAAHVANYAALQLGLPPLAAMLVGILAGIAMTIIPGFVNGWLIAHLQGAAVHRHARHVRRGARLGLSVRRRHDRLGQQPVVQFSSATAASSASRYW